MHGQTKIVFVPIKLSSKKTNRRYRVNRPILLQLYLPVFAVVAVPAVPAAAVTPIEFEVWLKSQSCWDLRPWELTEYTVVCWSEWEGPSGAGGESKWEPLTPPA